MAPVLHQMEEFPQEEEEEEWRILCWESLLSQEKKRHLGNVLT